MDPSRERDVEQGQVVTEPAPAVTPETPTLSGPLTAARIAALQRGAGNAAVSRLLNGRAPTGAAAPPQRPRSHGGPSRDPSAALARLLGSSSEAGGAGAAAEGLLEGAAGGAAAGLDGAAAAGGASSGAAGGAASGAGRRRGRRRERRGGRGGKRRDF